MANRNANPDSKPALIERLMLAMRPSSAAGEIARRTGLTSGAVTGLIDRLQRLGLVERMADVHDRRKVLVRVRGQDGPDRSALYAHGEVHARVAGRLQPRCRAQRREVGIRS